MGSSESIIHSTPNEACIVMEYLPLGTLKSYLVKNQKRKLAFKFVIRLALDLARGSVVSPTFLFVFILCNSHALTLKLITY